MRLLILLALIYIGYRVVRSKLAANAGFFPFGRERFMGRIEGEMIQDPVCKVYFPKKEGVELSLSGQTLYFCSEKCRDDFLSSSAAAAEKEREG